MPVSEDTLQLLRERLGLYALIPSDQWTLFCDHISLRRFKPGEFLFCDGDENLFTGFVLAGLVRSYFTLADGTQFTKNFSWEGRFVGPWVSILRQSPASFSAQAIEDTKIVAISAENFRKLESGHSCWSVLSQKITADLLIDREMREFDWLMLDNFDRYLSFQKRFAAIAHRIPQHLIASYLGITPVALSRILNKNRVER